MLSGLAVVDVALETRGYGLASLALQAALQVFMACGTPVSLIDSEPPLEAVFDYFDPSLRRYLRSIPIISSRAAQTAVTQTKWLTREPVFITVSPDFFRTAKESVFWSDYYSQPPYSMTPDQLVFPEHFRMQLLVHELLHVSMWRKRIEAGAFYRHVAEWYADDAFGRPTPSSGSQVRSNPAKYALWWYLYGRPGDPGNMTDTGWKRMDYCERYRRSPQGIEEFAYLGEVLAKAPENHEDSQTPVVSENVLRTYAGIIAPEALRL